MQSKMLLRRMVQCVKPYFHFLPNNLRHRIGNALKTVTDNRIKRPPRP